MNSLKMVFSLFIAFSLSASVKAEANDQTKTPRFLVHLLDYLAKDYGGAVGNSHNVLSQSEYSEQMEFVESAVKTNAGLTETKINPTILTDLSKLEALIKDKEPASQVSSLSRKIQKEVIEATHLEVFPARWPNLKQGQALYAQNCVNCHGDHGRGDGPAAAGLKPKPANFNDPDLMNGLAPFDGFNTIRLGVPGTPMPPFPSLSDEEIWSLSFYISSIRYGEKSADFPTGWNPSDQETLKKVASLSNENLKGLIPGDDGTKEKTLAALRTYSSADDQNGFLALAKAKLKEAGDEYQKGNFDAAKGLALQAYLEGIEPVEARIRASDADAVSLLEGRMAGVRASIEGKKDLSEVKLAIASADTQIDESAKIIEHKEMSPLVSFLAAFAILLREGFEAVLIILALLGIIRASGSKQAAHYVHSGWITALGCGAVAWIFSGWVMKMSGAGREMLEGLTSLFAVAVLLYVGFWLHRQSEIGRWTEFLNVKVKGFLHGKNLLGLAVISFMAVFREAFEVVLFLRAIWQEAGSQGQTAMLLGVLTALTLVIGLSWIALNLSKRLPLRQLFTVSSILMLALSTILIGKGLHSVQETGLLRVTSAPVNLHFELLGIYPTLETLTGQVIVFILVLAIWVYGKKPSSPSVSAR
jgi:high-affinity iron transporter